MKVMPVIKFSLFFLVLLIGATIAWDHWFSNEPQRPDVPALRLTAAQQNVYPQPASMVAIVLTFENEVTNVQEFANRILSQHGVVKLYALG